MSSTSVSEFMLVVIALALGIALFAITETILVPEYSFAAALQDSKTIASVTSVTVGPPIQSGNNLVYLAYIYSPEHKGNFSVVIFCVPQTQLQSLALLTPSIQGNPTVFLIGQSDTPAKQTTLNNVYDLNSRQLTGTITGFAVPANTPFQFAVAPPSGDAVVMWVIYTVGSYNFRVAYTFEG